MGADAPADPDSSEKIEFFWDLYPMVYLAWFDFCIAFAEIARLENYPDGMEYDFENELDKMEDAFVLEDPVLDYIQRDSINKRIRALLAKTIYTAGGYISL